jgi:hypothetical protein
MPKAVNKQGLKRNQRSHLRGWLQGRDLSVVLKGGFPVNWEPKKPFLRKERKKGTPKAESFI